MHPILIRDLQSQRIRRMVTALQHVADGKTTGETAALMQVDPATINNWFNELQHLMETTHARHTIAEALRKKLIR